jgi:HD-GYP domain-containing protein (c-di-GMP phosphodiesterase class II)
VPGSRHHADGTATYAFVAAANLGMERDHAEAVRETARLHEIGKIYVPRRALDRPPDELTPDELSLLGAHFAYGAELARGAGIPEEACGWIHATQERFDGNGPAGLADERIFLESRIIRAACTCDALVSAPIPEGESVAERRRLATEELGRSAGRELDPRIVEALVGMLERLPAGPDA